MVTVYDVPSEKLISALAARLKEEGVVEPPEWVVYAKSGVSSELPPLDEDWWYVRCASILRRVYLDGPVGVSSLKTYYGGRYSRGDVPQKHAKGSGSVIRKALQQLEEAGLITTKKEGRVITSKGRSYLDNTAYALATQLKSDFPELARYW